MKDMFLHNIKLALDNMKQIVEVFKKNGAILPSIFAIIGVILIIAGFWVPPLGVIDGSVLQGSGIILGFTALFKIESIVESIAEGRKVTFKHNNTEIEIDDK